MKKILFLFLLLFPALVYSQTYTPSTAQGNLFNRIKTGVITISLRTSLVANTGTQDSVGTIVLYANPSTHDTSFYMRRSSGWSKIVDSTTNAVNLLKKVDTTQRGIANGIATLDGSIKVPLTQLPYTAGTGISITSGVITNTSAGTPSNLALGTPSGTTVPITNSNGTGVTLGIATLTNAGVLSAGDKAKLDSIPSTKVIILNGGNSVSSVMNIGSTTNQLVNLIVNNVTSTQFGSSGIGSGGIYNLTSSNNGYINLANNGPVISRNVADANPVAYFNNLNSSNTGNLIIFANLGVNQVILSRTGTITANSFVKSGGTSSQYLMADGSVITARTISGGATITGNAVTTTFTITHSFGSTGYEVSISPTDLLAAAPYYITNKTSTTFDIVYTTAPTVGSVTFDWMVHKN